MRAKSDGPRFVELTPSTSQRPDVGFKMFIKILIAVVLPAPFGPTRPKTLVSGISKSKELSTRWLRKDFERSVAQIADFMIASLRLPSCRQDASNVRQGRRLHRRVRGRAFSLRQPRARDLSLIDCGVRLPWRAGVRR